MGGREGLYNFKLQLIGQKILFGSFIFYYEPVAVHILMVKTLIIFDLYYLYEVRISLRCILFHGKRYLFLVINHTGCLVNVNNL